MRLQVNVLGRQQSVEDLVGLLQSLKLTLVKTSDIAELPTQNRSTSGIPLVIADAETVLDALASDGAEQQLEQCQCVVFGDADHRVALDEAMGAGRIIFLQRPVDTAFLATILRDYASERLRSSAELEARTSAVRLDSFGRLYGSSPAMHALYQMLRKAANSDAALCLYGESGTGKELSAEAIHSFSSRNESPFIAVNCSAIPADLFESELFGHEKGSFSGAHERKRGLFESVADGTLFLDELTEMELDLQAKLLRVLETGVFRRVGGTEDLQTRARIVTATNRKPSDAVQFGRLREDLYYRISQLEIHLPPLRERGDDIVQLARHFANEYALETGQPVTLAPASEQLLQQHSWPGNVRELWNAIQIACTASRGEVTPAHLDSLIGASPPNPVDTRGQAGAGPSVEIAVGTSLADAERRLIFATLEELNQDKAKTADILGISLRTLYNRLKQYET